MRLRVLLVRPERVGLAAGRLLLRLGLVRDGRGPRLRLLRRRPGPGRAGLVLRLLLRLRRLLLRLRRLLRLGLVGGARGPRLPLLLRLVRVGLVLRRLLLLLLRLRLRRLGLVP